MSQGTQQVYGWVRESQSTQTIRVWCHKLTNRIVIFLCFKHVPFYILHVFHSFQLQSLWAWKCGPCLLREYINYWKKVIKSNGVVNPLVRYYHNNVLFSKLTKIQFSMKGSSSDYGETLLPLLAVMQDFVDNSLLAPTLVLVSFQQILSINNHCTSLNGIWPSG